MTTRRDHRRPVNAFKGASVVVWGCGGLGSWAGEFLVRAGAARITLCDPADVTGALLVRQDYTESDVGTTKAEALARRLAAVSDTVAIEIVQAPFTLLAEGQLPVLRRADRCDCQQHRRLRSRHDLDQHHETPARRTDLDRSSNIHPRSTHDLPSGDRPHPGGR